MSTETRLLATLRSWDAPMRLAPLVRAAGVAEWLVMVSLRSLERRGMIKRRSRWDAQWWAVPSAVPRHPSPDRIRQSLARVRQRSS